MTSSGVQARGLCKAFGDSRVIDSVDLDVVAGAVTIVTGPNGAGKTTLLRILATVMRPDAGSASVDGFDLLSEAGRVRERIGVALVNERSLFWRLSVRQNLVLFARTRGVPGPQLGAAVGSALNQLGLGGLAERRVATLSAGERQRVMLARAGLGKPSVLLIDEPLRGLDEDGVALACEFLTGRAEAGASVLVVAPMLYGLAGIADAEFVLADGRARSVGMPAA
jgi:ABC-type multidrug transport system ATPase subunit